MAGRYATALFELALETRALDTVAADLARFQALVAGSPDLARLVRSPVFSAEDQLKAVTAVLDKAKIGGLAANVVRVVASNRRLFAIDDVVGAYRKLVAAHKGETSADVTVAAPLTEPQLSALKGALKDITRKDVAIDLKVDPAIIGGLIVKMGSRMVDSSLRTRLNSIKFAMKEVG
jgi:F-type H+-transporting ATPase subunit delta